MNLSDRLEQLLKQFSRDIELEPGLLDRIMAVVARRPEAIEDLNLLSSALRDKSSTFAEQIAQLITCQECQSQLAIYVEEELAGQDVLSLYPKVALHLKSCVDCQEEYAMLSDLLVQNATGDFGEAPTRMNYAEWSQNRASDLWQLKMERVYQLVDQFQVKIHDSIAQFGQLPPLLQPQLTAAPTHRTRNLTSSHPESSSGQETVELLELPHIEANLVIKVGLGPVVSSQGTLVVTVGRLTPSQPITQAKVSLYDEDAELLESIPTDEDGVAFFRELELGKYGFAVEHAEQKWAFSMTLY